MLDDFFYYNYPSLIFCDNKKQHKSEKTMKDKLSVRLKLMFLFSLGVLYFIKLAALPTKLQESVVCRSSISNSTFILSLNLLTLFYCHCLFTRGHIQLTQLHHLFLISHPPNIFYSKLYFYLFSPTHKLLLKYTFTTFDKNLDMLIWYQLSNHLTPSLV